MTDEFDFSSTSDRLAWSATKWEKYRDRDVIPLWVADMDFAPMPAIQQRLAAQVAAGSFGYTSAPQGLDQQLAEDYATRYGWNIDPQWIVWLPGLVVGLNLAVRACTEPGQAVATFSRYTHPFLVRPLPKAANYWMYRLKHLMRPAPC